MAGRQVDADRFHPADRAEWRAWLAEHHRRPEGVWAVSWKKRSGRPTVSYDELVEEALCFGWIDSKGNKLDADRSMLWFAPRKAGSAWSRPNKERVARLEAAGLVTPAGRAVIEAAQTDGSWTRLDQVEALVVPDDLVAALAARPGAREQWDAFPRSARRGILEWIMQAKREPTRHRRVEETAERAAVGERANQWRRPSG